MVAQSTWEEPERKPKPAMERPDRFEDSQADRRRLARGLLNAMPSGECQTLGTEIGGTDVPLTSR